MTSPTRSFLTTFLLAMVVIAAGFALSDPPIIACEAGETHTECAVRAKDLADLR